MRRTIKDSDIKYAARMWMICVGLPCLALVIIGILASVAEGAVTYTPAPEHKCYAVLNALGSPPVQVPCDGQSTTPTTAPATPSTSTPEGYTPTASEYVGHGRTCFPAASWGPVSDNVRPCVRLVANKPEWGAVRFIVSDASGVVRYAGYVNTRFRRIVCVQVVRVAEDGSFTWKARSRDGRTITASVGNLED